MPFVLDASIAACWAFDDEDHPVAALALERVRTDEARVPSLWWFEVRNTLIVSERRGRLTESDTATFLHGLARLRVSVDRSPEEAITYDQFVSGSPNSVFAPLLIAPTAG